MIHRRSRAWSGRPLVRCIAVVTAVAATGALTTALAGASSVATPPAAGAVPAAPTVTATTTGGGATVTFSAPAVVAPGGTVPLYLDVQGAPTLAAIQASLRYDHRALEVSRVQFEDRTAAGYALQPLQTAGIADRTEIAAWSCPVAACDVALGAAPQANGSTTAAQRVVEIDVEPLAAGHVQLRVDGLMLVDATGSVITAHRSVAVTFAVGESAQEWTAPAAAAVPAASSGARAPADIDGDGRITIRDAQMLPRGVVGRRRLWGRVPRTAARHRCRR